MSRKVKGKLREEERQQIMKAAKYRRLEAKLAAEKLKSNEEQSNANSTNNQTTES